jgi:diacylglycerol kinase family enzyme
MGIAGRLRLLTSLTHGHIPSSNKLEYWTSPALTIIGKIPFAVEFDGEVITTAEARFSILPRHLRVCPC